MSQGHLSSQEIELVLLGEGLAAERALHLARCVACRRRRDELTDAIAGARQADPSEAVRSRARAVALAAAPRRRADLRWWLAAAAALVLAVLTAIFVAPALRPHPVDTDAVLLEVDEVLARDPLAAMADEGVVEVVVADAAAQPGGAS